MDGGRSKGRTLTYETGHLFSWGNTITIYKIMLLLLPMDIVGKQRRCVLGFLDFLYFLHNKTKHQKQDKRKTRLIHEIIRFSFLCCVKNVVLYVYYLAYTRYVEKKDKKQTK